MRRIRSGPRRGVPISVTLVGRSYSGCYVVDGDKITVTYGSRSSTTQIGSSAEAPLARLLLRDLVNAESEAT